MAKRLAQNFPSFYFNQKDLPNNVFNALTTIVKTLSRMHVGIVDAINFNAMEIVEQTAKPTPQEGKVLLWHDTDAPVGQSTHYIVANVGGTVVTFASEETA